MPPKSAAKPEETKEYDVLLVVSCLGNERRNISLGKCNIEQAKTVMATVSSSFETIRKSHCLMLTGADGTTFFVNLDNVAFIEVHLG